MTPTNCDVVIEADNFNLTSLAAVKLEYDIQTTDQDKYLSSQITRVSSSIASYCHRIFALQAYRDTFHASRGIIARPRGSILFLAQRPVVPESVTVTRDGVLLTEGSAYTVRNGRGEVCFEHTVWWTDIEVVYSAGWILPDWQSSSGSGPMAAPLPSEVEQAAIMMILSSRQAGRLAWTNRDPFLRSETVEGVGRFDYAQTAIGSSSSSGLLGAMNPEVMNLLAPYRMQVVA